MIRAFDWRDVGLVKSLADRGVCLDSETGLTQGNHPLQHALLSYLMPMAGAPTFIWRDGDHSASFGQLRHRPGDEQAWILYIAPAAQNGSDGWHPLIERLAVEAGERRAQNLVAEVNDKSPEFETLRRAGFAIYARHSLWKLAPERVMAPPADGAVALRPASRADTVAVNTLYCNVVPRLVQQVEPGPQHIERGYVLQDGEELVAYLDVRRGPQGIWVEPFLHPEAYDRSDAVMLACLQLLAGRESKPLYVCVRRYQQFNQFDVPAIARCEVEGSVERLIFDSRVGSGSQ